jgi:hypothetical protein
MEMHVDFLRDGSDPEHQKRVSVLNVCLDAGIEPPEGIMDYFGDTYDPDYPLELGFIPREIDDENRSGFEIDIDEIPEGTKTIRFYRS